jgi:hypothetical protein
MAGKNTAVFGVYSEMPNLENGLNELKQAGFRHEDISVLFPENLGSKELTTVKATKAAEGVAAGVGSGAVVGGALGWLAGIGALAIPGIGPFIAAGPIVAALAGVGVGSAVGGITGGLVGLGIPEFEAKRYEGRVRKGGILLSIHCDDSKWVKLAEQIIKQTGGQDISSTGEAGADYDKSDRPRPVTGTYGD